MTDDRKEAPPSLFELCDQYGSDIAVMVFVLECLRESKFFWRSALGRP
jgi:hypothetical protein